MTWHMNGIGVGVIQHYWLLRLYTSIALDVHSDAKPVSLLRIVSLPVKPYAKKELVLIRKTPKIARFPQLPYCWQELCMIHV